MRLAWVPVLTAAAATCSLALETPVARAQDGVDIYARCAVCHQANGMGVAAIFPPLVADPGALAKRAEGRRYLVLAIVKGLAGPIIVGGKPYRGAMPAQSLDDASVAAVLNHICSWSKASALKPFTTDEVKGIRVAGSGLSASDVARMQPKG